MEKGSHEIGFSIFNNFVLVIVVVKAADNIFNMRFIELDKSIFDGQKGDILLRDTESRSWGVLDGQNFANAVKKCVNFFNPFLHGFFLSNQLKLRLCQAQKEVLLLG
jgi:hypothetical protein